MKRKAQSLIEFLLLAAFVAIAAVSVGAIYNNQKAHLADMSKVNVNMKSVNLVQLRTTPNSVVWNDKVPYKATETAGALSIIGMTAAEYDMLMSNISYGALNAALNKKVNGQDLLTRVNALKDLLGIPYGPIVATDINVDTLSQFTEILNKLAETDTSTLPVQVKGDINDYIADIYSLLDEAKATLPTNKTETAGAVSVPKALTTPAPTPTSDSTIPLVIPRGNDQNVTGS